MKCSFSMTFHPNATNGIQVVIQVGRALWCPVKELVRHNALLICFALMRVNELIDN